SRVGVAARTTIAGERVSQEVQTDQSVPAAPPVYLRVEEARESDASFSWQAPPCLQTNGEITEYEFEVTPADRRAAQQKIANNVRGTRAQVTNLQPYTRYNVKVRAYTGRGAGPWSTEVPFQTAAAQTVTGTTVTMWTDAAPLTALAGAPRVIAEEATSITIEWDSRNREAGGFIVEY
ncbi:fibronectin type III domain protein, partial [Ancylostoma caninum]